MQKLLAEMYGTKLDMNVAPSNYFHSTIYHIVLYIIYHIVLYISDCYLEYFQHWNGKVNRPFHMRSSVIIRFWWLSPDKTQNTDVFYVIFAKCAGIKEAFTLNLTFLRGAGPIIYNEAVWFCGVKFAIENDSHRLWELWPINTTQSNHFLK